MSDVHDDYHAPHGRPFDPVEQARWQQLMDSRRLRFVDGFKFGLGLIAANLIIVVVVVLVWGASVGAALSKLLSR